MCGVVRTAAREERMRLRIASDLHNEFTPFVPSDDDADVVVLAGDIDIGKRGVKWAASAFAGKPVIYIPGQPRVLRRRAIPKLTTELIGLGADVGVEVLELPQNPRGSIRPATYEKHRP
jgi:hypothetical protein